MYMYTDQQCIYGNKAWDWLEQTIWMHQLPWQLYTTT